MAMCFKFLLEEPVGVDLSLGITVAGVEFGMKKFSGKISFQWAIAK